MGYAAVYIPEFPSAACMRLHTHLQSKAFAILEGKPPLQKLVSLNLQAKAMRLENGMSKVQAEASGLKLFHDRLLRDEENAFQSACEVLERFSPRIQVIAGPTNNYANEQSLSVRVVLDQTGTDRLFGSPEQYGQKLHGELKSSGFTASVAITSNAHASLLLARSHPGVTSVATEQIADKLNPLPVSLLPCEKSTLRVLARWGIRTLGELAALPEPALISRIGQQATHLQKLARGVEEHFMVPEPETFSLHDQTALDTPLEVLDSLLFVLSPMLGRLMNQAIAYAYALRSITLVLTLDKTEPYTLHIRPALPTQNRELLLKLLNLELQTRSPEAAILEVSLTAEATRPQTAQRGLFQAQFPDTDKLDVLLARLRSIAGEDNVGAPQLRNTHCDDEFAITTYQPNISPSRNETTMPARLALRRLRPPQSVRVMLSNGSPVQLFWNGQRLEVSEVKGPWQSSGYWWEHRAWAVEEWDAMIATPLQRIRLRHEVIPGQWMVAGIYD